MLDNGFTNDILTILYCYLVYSVNYLYYKTQVKIKWLIVWGFVITLKNQLFDAEFLYFTIIKMNEKFNSIEELLETEKAQEMMDENLSSYNDESYVYAVLELKYGSYVDGKCVYDFEDLENAINDIENQKYQIYHCMDCYYDSVDDLLEFPKGYEHLERYFDYDAYHRDCEYDVTEASNGIVIGNW